ncbi:MAG: CYTH domain-containing protein [Immundisolibacteraceae bacterium]|nr:CYTH domain-containing protein [Immundisolibacteraceae bacterium]
MATEIELKLDIDAEFIDILQNHPLLTGIRPSINQLENIYYDTADQQLRSQKMALRTRFDGQSWQQTLKTAGQTINGLHLRDEWETPIDDGQLQLDLLVAAGANTRTINWLSELDLKPAFNTRFERQCWLLTGGNLGADLVELVLDQGEVIAKNQSSPICEIELELKQGDVETLQKVQRQLQAAITLTPSNISKAARGYQLRQEIER